MLRSQPTLVLMYHRVATLPRDAHDLAVTPERFADHVDHLRRRERVVPLGDVTKRSRRRRVVVTFDDGYADNATVAADILEAAGMPATFFVTTELVGRTRDQWYDELELVLLDGTPRDRHVRLDFGDRPLLVDVGSDTARERAHRAIYRRLRPLRLPAIEDAIRQLREQIDAPAGDRPSHRFMTVEELERLAASDVAEVGGHAATHQQLSSLDEDEQRREIVDGRSRLQQLSGAPVRTFAYPFGGPEAFDDTSVLLVREAGYDLACVGSGGALRTRPDPVRVPRVVVKDWDRETFASRLEGWFRPA